MDKPSLVKFAENSECCLCLKTFTDPRVLPCLHTFCLNCLEKTGILKSGENFPCPVCGSQYAIPDGGAKCLQKNFIFEESPAVTGNAFKEKLLMLESANCRFCKKAGVENQGIPEKYCINCEESLCINCADKHSGDDKHLVVALGQKEEVEAETRVELKYRKCGKHVEELCDIFCTHCKVVTCKTCMEESHAGHSCVEAEGVAKDMLKLAEEEIASASVFEQQFLVSREKLHREKMDFLKEFKRMETEIMQRCERIKEMVCDETKAALKELSLFKNNCMKEIEAENQKLEQHSLCVEKFKEYCTDLISNTPPTSTCETKLIIRSTAAAVKPHLEARVQYQLMPVQFSLNKMDLNSLMMPLNSNIGRINAECRYRVKSARNINLGVQTAHGVTILQDRLYLLFDASLIYVVETPFSSIKQIQVPDIKSLLSRIGLTPCQKLSCLFVYDGDSACLWKVSISDHQAKRWLANVKDPLCISASPDGNVLIIRENGNTNPKTFNLKTYDEHAFLVQTLQLPRVSEAPKQVFEMPSGDYIICENKILYKVKPSGMVVCKFEISKHAQCGGADIQRIAVSPYHIYVATSNIGIGLVLLNLDLSWYRIIPFEGITMNSCVDLCYIEQTKQLACVDKVVSGSATVKTAVVTSFRLLIYDLL